LTTQSDDPLAAWECPLKLEDRGSQHRMTPATLSPEAPVTQSAAKPSRTESSTFQGTNSHNPFLGTGPVRHHPRVLTAIALGLFLGAFLSDWLTGTEVAASLFYLIAIMFAAWFLGRRAGLVLALLSIVGWIVAYYLVGDLFSKPSILYWNLFGEFSVYIAAALAVAEAKAGLDRVHDLAARLEQANQALDREVLAVGELQRDMLPKALPEIPGYECETLYLTSTRAGGDYYDFFPISGGRVGILVADASGHGAPAAVLMAMTRVLLRTASVPRDRPDLVLSRLNEQLVGTLPEGLFVTACYAVLDPPSGCLEYSLAGHDSPLVIHTSNGGAERVAHRGGLPLGLFDTAAYESGSTTLQLGDTLVLHTDGLTEAMSPTEGLFGEAHLLDALNESRTSGPAEMCRQLLARVETHMSGAPLSDDLTLLILRRLETSAGGRT
jgi:serine phosphatase RsbU (regulator of sigma subunit)